MEGRNRVGSSSSSFTSELFGSKESPSSSTGIFGSIFAPSSKVLGRESLRSELTVKRQNSPYEPCNSKPGAPGYSFKGHEGENQSIYQEQKVQPCHLSSSIYYGGQDVFSHPQSSQGSVLYKKVDGGEDDPESASRGNWWQGSLYY